MEIKEVKELMSQFNDSSLTEFDLREGSFELYMNKNQTSRQVSAPVQKEEQPAETVAASSNQTTAEPTASESGATAESKSSGQVITSPIVGIVYLQPSPEQEAFKSVGEAVSQGDTVCIIEAMKLLNEITSEFDGTITEILVENEDVVEYGQPLFRIG
ncbi:acetyl-CoA carboxylase biotin carboxyl carrier protein [Enterococcus gilvus]|jgi:acetyl-CoA carboxylase biotin carboxyl carrier protein|uniref:acetyl-CoA carboxylase biotin carboxyl carrier protein n=1 Tax=Enterococcus gilvus TaxID=160453 RepID=UPI000DF61A91|nr:acetyl-CoA carboxylase biotin carboxyl carrier protein [Enterococcus gilvus]AXG38617.1 acetyl-CoA carboxylase biotin carboxyl carrier protein [Enterococcus gilvus]